MSRETSDVWVVVAEMGVWEREDTIVGVFSSRELAIACVESQTLTMYRHVGTVKNVFSDGEVHVDAWTTQKNPIYPNAEVVETVDVHPTVLEGSTFYADGEEFYKENDIWRFFDPNGRLVDIETTCQYVMSKHALDEGRLVTGWMY